MNDPVYTSNLALSLPEEWTLLSEIKEVAANIHHTPCGGTGRCGKCRIKINSGASSPLTEEELKWLNGTEIESGIRLACYCMMKGKIELGFTQKREHHILTDVLSGRDDCITTAGTLAQRYGVAIDIGTTTVAGLLIDLDHGKKLSAGSRLNPQSSAGTDLLTRISYSSTPGNTEKLQGMILKCIDDIINEICHKSKKETDKITDIAITGNTVMLHLLAGVPPSALGCFPYHTVFTGNFSISAKTLGLKSADNAEIFFSPSASGFIGSDIVSGVLSASLESEENSIIIDMGTNGEMVLHSNNTLWGCSVAMGPALEGMNIECGMRAEAGAIDRVWIGNNRLNYGTISNAPPAGLCGSGIIDIVNILFANGIINSSGKMITGMNSGIDNFIITEGHGKKFLITPDNSSSHNDGIYISQKDIRNIQLVKGAVSSGLEILLETACINSYDVKKIFLSGALGYYSNTDNLIDLGFFPGAWRDRIIPAGNTSLAGAVNILLSVEARLSADRIARSIKTIDLTSHHDFQSIFIKFMTFGTGTWE